MLSAKSPPWKQKAQGRHKSLSSPKKKGPGRPASLSSASSESPACCWMKEKRLVDTSNKARHGLDVSRNYLVLAILTPKVSSSITTGSDEVEPFLRLRGALSASSWRFFSSRRFFFASASPGWTKSFSTKSLNCERKTLQ